MVLLSYDVTCKSMYSSAPVIIFTQCINDKSEDNHGASIKFLSQNVQTFLLFKLLSNEARDIYKCIMQTDKREI